MPSALLFLLLEVLVTLLLAGPEVGDELLRLGVVVGLERGLERCERGDEFLHLLLVGGDEGGTLRLRALGGELGGEVDRLLGRGAETGDQIQRVGIFRGSVT